MSATANRFRKAYRPLLDHEKKFIDALKDKAEELAQIIDEPLGDPRARALALTNLEQAAMWAVKGVTG